MAGNALIVGAGEGISASFARLLARNGVKVALAARRPDKLAGLAGETGASVHGCDVVDAGQVARLFEELDQAVGALDLVLYNPSYRTNGALVELDPAEVQKALMVSAYGGFLVAQQAARRMLRAGRRARSCSPAPRRASRATNARRRSRWASSRCAGSPRAWRASSRPRTSTSRIS